MKTLQIMLAEDSALDLFLVEEALKHHHIPCVLHGCKDGVMALRYLEQVGSHELPCPDLVLLDLHLPAVDGPEILTALRQHPTCARVPVIVTTSSDAPKDRATMTALGISHYFQKPKDLVGFMDLGRIILEVATSEVAE